MQVFDLYYFDGLARQDEEIKLTVTPQQEGPSLGDEEVPLNNVVRTRWLGVEVDWNGVEPWL